MSESGARRPWSAAPFLSHLNQRHPDSVQFLARHLLAQPNITRAELLDVEGDRLNLRVESTGESRAATVTLHGPVRSRADLVRQLSVLLSSARAASPEAPLTSLESEIASRPSHGHR